LKSFFLFQTLTKEQRKLIAKTASEKYRLDIAPSQIAHLVLDRFECNFYFQDESNYITGKVRNFQKFPLRIDFDAPEGNPGREALLSGLQQNINLEFRCKLTAVSHTVKINTLAISSSEFQEMGIREKLLGPASSVYVSREQLNLLAGQLFSSLNVVEEYEMPEYKFKQNFVEDFIGLASEQHFHHVPAMEALKKLSSYGFQFQQDLQPGKSKYNIYI
jgi:hypothetical protein